MSIRIANLWILSSNLWIFNVTLTVEMPCVVQKFRVKKNIPLNYSQYNPNPNSLVLRFRVRGLLLDTHLWNGKIGREWLFYIIRNRNSNIEIFATLLKTTWKRYGSPLRCTLLCDWTHLPTLLLPSVVHYDVTVCLEGFLTWLLYLPFLLM